MLKTENLTKNFGNNKGVFDICIEIQPGEIVGFIGPNGAGKSTTINMITGLLFPNQGTVELFGKKMDKNNIQSLKEKMGILYSQPYFEPNLKTVTILERQASLQKIKDEKWSVLANLLDLDNTRNFGKLSLGNKKKVGIISALMNTPDLLILDEPTSGLDPLIQKKFLDLLLAVKKRGGSVFLSSHVLNEVEAICDRIIMIKNGKIIKQAKTSELIQSMPKIFKFTNLPAPILNQIQALKGNLKEVIYENEVKIYTNQTESILEILYKNKISNFFLERSSLEEMFLENYG